MDVSRRRLLRASGATLAFGTALGGAVSAVSGHADVRDEFLPAHASNYESADRTPGDVRWVVLHTVEGTYEAGIATFRNPASDVSSHFVVGNQPGQITQMVDVTDVAYTAGNYGYNAAGTHVELEGYADATDFGDALYRQAADVVRWVCEEYDVPERHPTFDLASCDGRGAGGVIGHDQIPDPDDCRRVVDGRSDPGDTWDWDYFMSIVRDGGRSGAVGGGTDTSDVGAAFAVDDRVRVTPDIGLVIHTRAALAAPDVWAAPEGSAGYVRDGPVENDGYVWWKVAFNAGYVGWCVGRYLEEAPIGGGGGSDGGDGGGGDLVTPANVRDLGRILTTEAGRFLATESERTAVGYVVVNRMNAAGTDAVRDVWNGFAHSRAASGASRALAREILAGEAPDRTDGAYYFYSPRSMPAAGDATGSFDVRGGLEWVPGLPQANYRPGWARDNERVFVEGVRPEFFKFFTTTPAPTVPDCAGGVCVGETVTAGAGGATAYHKPREFSSAEGSVSAGTDGTVVGDGIREAGGTRYAKVRYTDGTVGYTPVGQLQGGSGGGSAPDPRFADEDRVTTADETTVRAIPGRDAVAEWTAPADAAGYVRGDPTTAGGEVWYQVGFNAGHEGWVPQSALDPAPLDAGVRNGGGGSGRRTESGTLSRGESTFFTHSPIPGADELRLRLDGPTDGDLDLYVTYDGRQPTPEDFDDASRGENSTERLTVSPRNLSGTVGILVDARSGSGSYELSVRPAGGGPSGGSDGSGGNGGGSGGDSGPGDGSDGSGGGSTGGGGGILEAIIEFVLGLFGLA